MKWSWKLTRLAGIDVYVHVTENEVGSLIYEKV